MKKEGKEHRAMMRKAIDNQWQTVANTLTEADAKRDWRAFWENMRKLKLYGAHPGNPVRFSPKDLQEHSSKIGREHNVVSEEMLANMNKM